MNNIIKFVVTKQQSEKIKQIAKANNTTISKLIRQKILQPNYPLEKMIIEIHEKVIQIDRNQTS